MIALTVNGERRELEGPIRLTAFLESVGVDPRYVAVARNGDVLPREQWPDTTLQDGDVLEVVRMVGGGTSVRGLVESCRHAVCRIVCHDHGSVGSGFFVRPGGIVVTCNHVVSTEDLTPEGLVEISYSQDIEISSAAGTFRGRIAHSVDDVEPYFYDFAILAVDVGSHAHLEIGDYAAIHPGDDVLVLGYPLGVEELTATRGMVAARHRSPSHMNQLMYLDMLRVDAAINVGNSGGPLLDYNGRVVGVVTLRLGSIKRRIDSLRQALQQAPDQPFYRDMLDLFEMGNAFMNPGLGEAVSIRYVQEKLPQLGL